MSQVQIRDVNASRCDKSPGCFEAPGKAKAAHASWMRPWEAVSLISGAAAQTLTIMGTNFVATSTVTHNGLDPSRW
ncbi:MAG: hypothetical protein ABSF46_30205 [Terriglobia bacterium]|jgi:hypothetical protein